MIIKKINPYIIIRLWILFVLTLMVHPLYLSSQEPIVSDKFNQIYLKGLRLIGAQKYDEAMVQFKEMINQNPSFPRAYVKLVAAYKKINELDKARQYFEELIAKDPENPYAYHGLGLIYREKKAYQKAFDNFLKSIQLNFDYYVVYPDFVDAHRELDKAKKNIATLIAANPDNAAAHYGMAYIYEKELQWESQLEESKRAVELRPDILEARNLVSWAYYQLGEYGEGLEECNLGLKLAQEKGDFENEIEFLRSKALITNKLNDPAAALNYLDQALELSREIGDKGKASHVLNVLIRIHWYLSEYHQALQYASQELEIDTEISNKNGQASSLNYMGLCHDELGEYSKALEYYEKARNLYQEIGNTGAEGICIGNSAGVYIKLGDALKALSLLKQAVKILSKLGSGWEKYAATYIGNMGEAFKKLGNYKEALNHYNRALQTVRELKTEEHQVSYFLSKIGGIYQEVGDYSQALKNYEDALKINTRLFKKVVKAGNLISIGRLYLAMENYANAKTYYEDALKICGKIQAMELVWKAEAGLGYAYQKQGKDPEAIDYYKRAVNTIEKLRGQLKLEEEKIGFFGDKTQVYADLINLLAGLHQQYPNKGYEVEAFHYAERAKARAFLDILAEARADVRSGIEPRFKHKERDIFRKFSRIQTQFQAANLSDPDWSKLTAELRQVEDEHDVLKREIRRNNPKYGNLIYPEPYRLVQVQKDVLDESTALLEFSLGQESSYVWLITRENSHLYLLLGRSDIERGVEEYLRTISKPVGLTNPFSKHFSLGYELYTMLLGPVIGGLKGKTHLMIVPDGVLHYLPFETLITQKVKDNEVADYLLKGYKISYAPSSSVLGYLQDEKGKVRKERLQLLAFGDPYFGRISEIAAARGEERQKALQENSTVEMKPGDQEITNRGLYERRGFVFRRLPFSGTEVMEIADLFPATEKVLYLGEKAKEEVVKSEALERFKYIHFATHGVIEQKVPSRSGIVLTLDEDATEDGFLQVNEILNLKLNAELVVLSACQTGLGKLLKGEGIVGLSRAFMYAGTPSVVVSLWKINDRSTANLMKNFYAHLKKGRNKTEALRLGKLQMLQSERKLYRHPFYWAPFVLIGDYK